MARSSWPALDIHLPDAREGLADRIGLVLALLDDFAPSAIDETTSGAPGLRAYFTDEDARDRAAVALQDRLGPTGVTAVPQSVADEGWAERSQSLLTPIRVGRVIVTPPWHRHAISDSAVAVTINPSMGFGTGHHQTTRLCLAGLQTLVLEHRSVLDIGTGSGVLAIASVLLGAASALGVDSDPDAVQAAQENVALNPTAQRVDVRVADFRSPGFSERREIVLANLTGPMLQASAERLVGCTAPGGTLVISGFTTADRDDVLAAFAGAARFTRESAEDEWTAAILGVW